MSQPDPKNTTPDACSLHKDEESIRSITLDIPEGYHQSRGVTRMENLHRMSDRRTLLIVGSCIIVCAWAHTLDKLTLLNYAPFVTSNFRNHSGGLAALSIATSLIGAVSRPFIAKFADVTSRPHTYTLILAFYVIGHVIVASCTNLSAYIVSSVFATMGSSGVEVLNAVIVGDLTPLEWRGFVTSMLTAPYIINCWFSGLIVEAILKRNQWRWGYGMFAVILPAMLIPAIVILTYYDRKAQRLGILNIASSETARKEAEKNGEMGPGGVITAATSQIPKKQWTQHVREGFVEIDAFGLLLLGFGWSLLLLPFSSSRVPKRVGRIHH